MVNEYSKDSGKIAVDVQPFEIDSTHSSNGRTEPSLTGFKGFIDGFKPPNLAAMKLDPNMTEQEKVAHLTANSPLLRSLKNRHLQMIAFGGSIGTGLFVGSGSSLRTGGPAGLIIAYILIGSMMFSTIQSMGELVVTFPVAGSILTYNTRFIDPSWGFAMSWNYGMGWLATLPLELVAASLTMKNWSSVRLINSAAFVGIFYTVIVAINLLGVRGYGEAEFVFSLVKILAVIGFIILGIVLVAGGGPVGGFVGGKYWHDPGAFANGFKGVCSVFVSAAFAFSGTELFGLAAAESANPRQSLTKATKQVFWRITFFYLVTLTLVGLLVPYNDKRLFGASSVDVLASPFVLAIRNGGIKGLPSVMNVVVMISVLSVANSSVFASLRTLAAIAASGMAPKALGYIDKTGRPIVAIGLQFLVGLLCFLAALPKEAEVFKWLLALSGLSAFFVWGSINLSYLRFRRALSVQGRTTDELAHTSLVGPYGAIYGLVLIFLCLVSEFWLAVFPIGKKPSAYAFFLKYLSAVVILLLYSGHKLYTRNWKWFIRAKDMDIDTGRREVDMDLLKQELAEEKMHIASLPFYHRIYKFWC